MKKLIAMLLALMMIFSLAACAAKDNTADKAPADDAGDTADTDDKSAASNDDIFAVMILPNVSEVVFSGWAEAAQAKFDEVGIKFEAVSCDDDVNVMNQQIENYVVMGATHMFCQQISADGQSEALKSAVEAGIDVIIVNFCDDEDSYTSIGTVQQYDMGDIIAKQAAQWIEDTFPDAEDGSIEVAIFGTLAYDHVAPRTEAMSNITEYTSKAVIVENYDYGASMSPNKDAQDWMENLLLKYPDIKCVIGQAGTVLEMNEVVMANDSIDKSTIGMFTDTESPVMFEEIAKSANNESTVRGLCTFESIGNFYFTYVTDKASLTTNGKEVDIKLFTCDVTNVDEYLS